MNIKKIPFLNFVVPTFNPLLAYIRLFAVCNFQRCNGFSIIGPAAKADSDKLKSRWMPSVQRGSAERLFASSKNSFFFWRNVLLPKSKLPHVKMSTS
jgi:hypothetical protein